MPERRRGPRVEGPATRDLILEAARNEFAEKGFDAVSMRQIARTAGVDPALIRHYFASKEAILVATLNLPVNPVEVIVGVAAGGLPGAGERLLRAMLGVWDQPSFQPPLLAVARAALSGSPDAPNVQAMVLGPMMGRFTNALGCADPQWSADLVASQMVGLIVARYVVRVEPLASAPVDDVVAAIAPTLQRYLELD